MKQIQLDKHVFNHFKIDQQLAQIKFEEMNKEKRPHPAAPQPPAKTAHEIADEISDKLIDGVKRMMRLAEIDQHNFDMDQKYEIA